MFFWGHSVQDTVCTIYCILSLYRYSDRVDFFDNGFCLQESQNIIYDFRAQFHETGIKNSDIGIEDAYKLMLAPTSTINYPASHSFSCLN